jgi:ketosteroid isomerase-like protein
MRTVVEADAERQWRPTVLFLPRATQYGVDVFDCEVLMYHRIVKKRIISVFERLGKGDYEYALSDVGTTIEHRFAGEHSLGGTRTSTTTMRYWFERLYRLFPNLRFEMHSIAVSGGPWDTTVVVEWTDRATPADGNDYVNLGVHVIRMRWGKVVSIHAYLDTQVLIDTLDRMAANGIEEAKASPITG